MDKSAIKKYAVWARRELISRVSNRALLFGISEEEIVPASASTVGGAALTEDERKQRKALIEKISKKGYTQVIEEVAYTWFNRFSALRFMEVNGYLPSRVRVFTDADNAFKPQILSEALHLELPGLDRQKVIALKESENDEALFKYLVITQCNALNPILPGMFERIADETELLFPDNLLRDGSVIEQMIAQIPEKDWKDAIQIIGWLYQYYNAEKKDEVFAALKRNVKVTKENIPAATQLFTPDWIVRYMVENSLGRLWVEGHPDTRSQFLPSNEDHAAYAAGSGGNSDGKWYYYLEEADQEPEVKERLDEIHREYSALTPEDILCIDPCAGSGHILCYLFDVLFQIYQSYGYTTREAVASIVEKNLWGLDIDERAAQLSYFAVMMKARKYDSRFLTRKDENGNPNIPEPHVYAIVESNGIDKDALDYFCNGRQELIQAMQAIVEELHDAKEYGSILTVMPQDWGMIYARLDEVERDISIHKDMVLQQIKPLVQVAHALSQKYHVVDTNPPYMGSSGMSGKLAEHVKKHYPDSKSDLFAVFIERCGEFTKKNGCQAMITQHAWMFLSSFEKLRQRLLLTDTVNMTHLGARAFEEIGGEVVQTTSFVLRKSHIEDYQGVYCRLIEPTTQDEKERMFFSDANHYIAKQSNFSKIPGSPVAYWISDAMFAVFRNKPFSEYADARIGLVSGDNNRFLRLWFEVDYRKTSIGRLDLSKKWFPLQKGGGKRYWYGNLEYLINWEDDGDEIKNKNTIEGRIRSHNYNGEKIFLPGITWNSIGTSDIICRLSESGYIYDAGGPLCTINQREDTLYYLALLSSKVASCIYKFINPTINYTPGTLLSLPIIISKEYYNTIKALSNECVELSRSDWNAFEDSWDFQNHPLVRRMFATVVESFKAWQVECEERFQTLKANEEELNRIFIEIYGLQDELTPEVEDRDVTVRHVFDTKEDIPESMRGNSYALTKRDVIVSLISYAVGCMFGRYSLDVDGLAYAGGELDESKYKTFIPDKDGILPVSDDEYFDDDIVNRFVEFVRVVYGDDTLEENLKFIAYALGGTGTAREVIRKYFLNDFYADHCRTYQKRPIYWLFDSGKKNGFKCLVYMHRYQPDTIARIRTDYVHEQQSRYRTVIDSLESRMNGSSTSERVRLSKTLKKLQDQASEVQVYEEKIHHLADQFIPIDLDDGVKVNYAKFQDVLAKIK